jgi:diguanylate cyclase (GGDEF)-like protein
MAADFLPTRYDHSAVALSMLVAAFGSYVALDLARRVHEHRRWAALAWVVGGAFVMGSGIWAMHFIGMLALQLPIAVAYAPGTTFVSWAAAVGVSALALGLASRERLGVATLAGGALAMGGGICVMHYTGMAALELAPGIVWDPLWVGISALIAVAASGAALAIFFAVRRLAGARALAAQVAAAIVMGLAISGMHYSGMSAAAFPAGSVCLSADGLGGMNLGLFILLAVALLLTIALLTSGLDARLQARANTLTRSLKDANAQLQRIAFIDPLTGVPNRALFQDRLAQVVARVDRSGGRHGAAPARAALLYVDLDGFKPVNDTFGHAAGDRVLVEVAERLKNTLRGVDTLARLGGDEFVLLLEDVSGAPDAVATAQRALQSLVDPIDIAERTVVISASVGIVLYPDHGPAERLLPNADAAMYAAKHAGRGTYAVFEAHMHEGVESRFEMLQDLREAIARRELKLYYQAKVNARTGRAGSVEALLRWNHPQGLVSPGVFIPLAERFGLMGVIGAWVLEEACRQLAVWADDGRRMRVSINLSPFQLRQPDIARRIGEAIARHGVAADQLVCEITETAAMEDTETTARVLEELRDIGVKLSIDDFGTGYSSLAKLRRMRTHELKIDREFVADVATDRDARAVVDAIVRLGHALGLRVVAEGVETADQRRTLEALGCDELQGFYFARPVPPEQLVIDGHDEDGERVAFSPSVLADGI